MGLLNFEVLSALLPDSLPCNDWPACNAPDEPPGMLAAPIGMLDPVRSAALAAASSCRYTRVSMQITLHAHILAMHAELLVSRDSAVFGAKFNVVAPFLKIRS
jgi:hypothetical protein